MNHGLKKQNNLWLVLLSSHSVKCVGELTTAIKNETMRSLGSCFVSYDMFQLFPMTHIFTIINIGDLDNLLSNYTHGNISLDLTFCFNLHNLKV